jgi:Cation transporting ATPase, C-terminus
VPQKGPGAPCEARRRASGERHRRGRGAEDDRTCRLGQNLAAAPEKVASQSDWADWRGHGQREPEGRRREGERGREQQQGEGDIAGEDASGQDRSRVAGALAAVDEQQPQRVAGEEAGEDGADMVLADDNFASIVAAVETVMAVATLLAIDAVLPAGLVPGSGSTAEARTVAFTTLVLAQLVNVFCARSDEASAFRGLFANPWLWLAVLASVLLQLVVVSFPASRRPSPRCRSGRGTGPCAWARPSYDAASRRRREPRSRAATAATSGTTPATRKTPSAAERAHSSVWKVPFIR